MPLPICGRLQIFGSNPCIRPECSSPRHPQSGLTMSLRGPSQFHSKEICIRLRHRNQYLSNHDRSPGRLRFLVPTPAPNQFFFAAHLRRVSRSHCRTQRSRFDLVIDAAGKVRSAKAVGAADMT